jgi:hypothetical protein
MINLLPLRRRHANRQPPQQPPPTIRRAKTPNKASCKKVTSRAQTMKVMVAHSTKRRGCRIEAPKTKRPLG